MKALLLAIEVTVTMRKHLSEVARFAGQLGHTREPSANLGKYTQRCFGKADGSTSDVPHIITFQRAPFSCHADDVWVEGTHVGGLTSREAQHKRTLQAFTC